jgi:hypothetical protein
MMRNVAATSKLPALGKGLDERTTPYMDATDRVEIRITGRFIRELSVATAYYELSIDTNALFISRCEDGKDYRAIIQAIGAFQAAMNAPIPNGRRAGKDSPSTSFTAASLRPSNRRSNRKPLPRNGS